MSVRYATMLFCNEHYKVIMSFPLSGTRNKDLCLGKQNFNLERVKHVKNKDE